MSVYSQDVISAEWRAYNNVLNFLNTLEDSVVKKSVIYRAVMDMRPATYRAANGNHKQEVAA